MIRRAALFSVSVSIALAFAAAPVQAAEVPCALTPKAQCFGLESLAASLSTDQAGGHPDIEVTFDIKKDPESDPNDFGLKDAFAPTRTVRIESPPGLIGDPSVLGLPQQCTALELSSLKCPNGSQIGIARIFAYELHNTLLEPIYMMQPPGGDVVARLGLVAGTAPTYIDARVRTESDYGLTLEFTDAPTLVKLIRSESTLWGVPAHPSHDTERCMPQEVLTSGCEVSPARPPGSRPLPFTTNPTRCGVPLEMRVSAASWAEPNRFDAMSTSFPQITGCNHLPFGPSLTIEPTSRRAGAPVGLDITARLPASDGVEVREPSQVREIRVALPEGMAINTGAAEGLDACSEDDVNYGDPVAAECPEAAKMAEFEALIPALPRRLKGAIYLRDPEPGNLFRFWAVADDLGVHVKLPGQLDVNKQTGQIGVVVADFPQAPLREAKIVLKSGFRAPLVNPTTCGTYASRYEFVPWSGGPPVKALSPISINDGCDSGGFAPKLSAGTTNPSAGDHSPFLFTLTREDGEQNPAAIDIRLPQGLAATFAGISRCEGGGASLGDCPPQSRIGKVIAAAGAGPAPLWVPQPGKRPTAVYLAGPYKGAPFSVIAVVPAQAGPFDLGNQVVRSAIYVDPVKAQGIVRSDPLPQFIEGIPIRYRTVQVQLDRPDFTLNPTNCEAKSIEAGVTSVQGAVARPNSPFRAVNCARLPFKPQLSFSLRGGTKRGGHPQLRAVLKARTGDANIAGASVALPHSEFLDQAHIGTVCTRVQFAANQCPPASIYGHAVAKTPLLDQPLSGPVYLRSSNNPLPDMVVRLGGEITVELSGRVDSINGGIRNTFDFVPDAPVSSFVLTLRSGKKGLLVNSTNLCAKIYRATAEFKGQNGRTTTLHPEMRARCGKASGARKSPILKK